MRNVGFLLSLLLFSSAQVWSQAQPTKESIPSAGAFYVGDAYTGSNPASSASAGVGGGLEYRVYKWIEIQGDISAFFATAGTANLTTTVDYLAGPRIAKPPSGSRFNPFADFLAGGQSFHNGSTQHTYYYGNGSGLALAADGGVDVRLARHLALRGQAGFISSRYATAPTTTSNNRWRAGTFLVFRF